MLRSTRIQSLVKIASNEEEAAAKELAEAIANFEKQRTALQELTGYRDEYTNRFRHNNTTSVNALGMQQFHGFVAQLNQGIEQQSQAIVDAEKQIEQKRALWVEKHNRTRALDKVVEKFMREEHMSEEKLEQKLLDEYALRGYSKSDK